jgi:hypothetical protein
MVEAPPLPLPAAKAKLVDFYAAYCASILKRAANRERVYSLNFSDWYANIYVKKAA